MLKNTWTEKSDDGGIVLANVSSVQIKKASDNNIFAFWQIQSWNIFHCPDQKIQMTAEFSRILIKQAVDRNNIFRCFWMCLSKRVQKGMFIVDTLFRFPDMKNQMTAESFTRILIRKSSWLQTMIFSFLNFFKCLWMWCPKGFRQTNIQRLFFSFMIWKFRWQLNCSREYEHNSDCKKQLISDNNNLCLKFFRCFECACPRGSKQTFRGFFQFHDLKI